MLFDKMSVTVKILLRRLVLAMTLRPLLGLFGAWLVSVAVV
jgi:hypothetical protein